MSNGQLRAIGHERKSARQQMSPPRLLRDDRCRECRLKNHSKCTSTSARDSCPHRRDFAPTANRFSLLAEIDRKANQTKWAFDFTQSPNSSVRRRGKRGGKANRLRHDNSQRQLEDCRSESESVDDLCKRTAPDGEDPGAHDQRRLGDDRNCLPHADFTFCADGVRHHWMPQFRPNSSASQSPKLSGGDGFQLPRPLERCLTQAKDPTPPVELTEFKRRESRFFPLSAFLATPDTAARHPSKSSVPAPIPAKTSASRKQLSVSIPTASQRAAASAAKCALANQKVAVPPLAITRNTHTSRPASPSSLAQTSTPLSPPPTPRSEAGCLLHMQAPCTPLSVTPSTASSTLTISPSVSAVPSLVPAPSLISSLRTSCPRRSPPPLPLPPRPQLSPTTSLSLGSWTGVSTPETISPALPTTKEPLIAHNPIISYANPKPKTPQRLTKFFDKPCPPAVPVLSKLFPQAPLKSAVHQDLEDFLRMGHASPCWCSYHNSAKTYTSTEAQSTSSVESRPSLVVVKSRTTSELDLDDVLLTPSPLGSDFEDLETTDCDGDIDEEWTVLTPDERCELLSLPKTPNLDIDDTITVSGDCPHITWSSSLLTPLDSPASLPETSIQTANHADMQPTNHSINVSQLEGFIKCPEPVRDCATANTSAVEWPTLQEAVQIKRTRREKRSGTNDADVTRFCNQMVDWMV
ncbi:hypothetical protein K491DRAFT_711642 [Lophiostoma macrostomum CBS 122681]|uniref:Uncharacterized protein n=1 Tax=Lophiostoma macrostomum CBS 122681 TaxID=1314788 RepID=A0A6A6TK67_9PLEO|nr:hypothetical protein K491DRAFT_711642 [Lophiostoma macrostomum CBS 122681]